MDKKTDLSKITVCYFGTYIPEYPRNKVIIKGLQSQGINIIECQFPLWHGIEPRIGKIKGFRRKLSLSVKILWAQLNLIIKHQNARKYDLMLVGYTGHFDIPIAKLLSLLRRKPLVFDFFWSMYCSFVEDRKLFKKGSLISNMLKSIDRFSCKVSNLLLLDTQTHIEYTSKTLNVDKEKFKRIWVGADESIFYPIKRKERTGFTVLFFGTFIPLQGIKTILRSARILERQRIKFRIIGKGQLSTEVKKLAKTLRLKNCDFIDWVPMEDLPTEISNADVCLGIFGSSMKADSVIPNKVFDSIACNKSCITEDSLAIREIFTDKKDIFLVPAADEESLSRAILTLKNNNSLRDEIAQHGYNLFLKHFSTFAIGYQMINLIKEIKVPINPDSQVP